jgi:hypothetical protein
MLLINCQRIATEIRTGRKRSSRFAFRIIAFYTPKNTLNLNGNSYLWWQEFESVSAVTHDPLHLTGRVIT